MSRLVTFKIVLISYILTSALFGFSQCSYSKRNLTGNGRKCGDVDGFISKSGLTPNSLGSCRILSDQAPGIGNNHQTYRGSAIGNKVLISFSLIFLFLSCSYGIMQLTRTAKLVNEFGGPTPVPLIGNCGILIGNPEDFAKRITRLTKEYGRCFRFWIFHTPYIFVTEAQSAEKVLSSSVHLHKGRDYKMFKWFFGNGLVTSDVHVWKQDRKLLSPGFKYQRFDGFLASFNKHGGILVDILTQKYPQGGSNALNLHSTICLCTIDSISESALGQNSAFQYDPNVKFVEKLHVALESFRLKLMKPWLVWPIVWDIFGDGRKEPGCIDYFKTALGQVIESRRTARLLEDEDRTKPFIDSMLDCRTDEEIVYHVITTFAAGFETTASAINYTLYLLGQNPDAQVKVHEELDRVVGTDVDKDLSFTDLVEMKYLEMCIKESLRLFPPAPCPIRAPKEHVKLDNGMVIPPGTQVIFCLYELHRDPTVFPNPEKFDPERFLPEACAKRNPYAYLPFSTGPRSCLGQKYAMMQVKVVLAHVLRAFRISSSTPQHVEVIYGMVLEPKGGIHLQLERR